MRFISSGDSIPNWTCLILLKVTEDSVCCAMLALQQFWYSLSRKRDQNAGGEKRTATSLSHYQWQCFHFFLFSRKYNTLFCHFFCIVICTQFCQLFYSFFIYGHKICATNWVKDEFLNEYFIIFSCNDKTIFHKSQQAITASSWNEVQRQKGIFPVKIFVLMLFELVFLF